MPKPAPIARPRAASAGALAGRLREAADRLTSKIDDLRRPRADNTPKRAKEAAKRRIEADHNERCRQAYLTLAEMHENGVIPDLLCTLKPGAQVFDMLRTKVDHSGGYYSIRDTGEYSDQSPAGIALRELVLGRNKADFEKLARQRKIQELEADVKFANIPGFFPTPIDVISIMLEKSQIGSKMIVLEPSAGKGDIADAVRDAADPTVNVLVCEINQKLREILTLKGHMVLCQDGSYDFLDMLIPNNSIIDRILMNPPFEKGQDIDHVQHAYQILKSGGRLVSIMSMGPFFRGTAFKFRTWFDEVGGEMEKLPPESFKDGFCSTGANAVLVTIDKP